MTLFSRFVTLAEQSCGYYHWNTALWDGTVQNTVAAVLQQKDLVNEIYPWSFTRSIPKIRLLALVTLLEMPLDMLLS